MPFLLPDAWESLKRNRAEVLLYLGVQFCLILAAKSLEYFLEISADTPQPWYPAYNFIMSLIQTFVISGLMAIVFARLGEDIDRPLWSCPSDREALQRFLVPWLIINLALVTFLQLGERAYTAEQEDLALLFMGLSLFTCVMAIPVGACVMYHGRLRWQEIGVTLRPISAQFGLTVQVIVLMFLQFILFILVHPLPVDANIPQELAAMQAQIFYWPIVTVPINLIDCVAFAMMWRILMIHRDEGVDDVDPFDF